ncbi:porin [Comamonas aquatica]|uniref:Porin n=2 Tax=Comamonas aquatica TaxID=225991 RepID=A0AA42W745_9BURK|nr:porin [Comamonas aquatica]MDH1428420.1 porin [Comamonas aquatica]MDH1607670.1 porin [Comamonas aquatica]MDH1619426.1 porin [Comamonas aquatica]MDH2007414.1 porin [Comamonas aquatica]
MNQLPTNLQKPTFRLRRVRRVAAARVLGPISLLMSAAAFGQSSVTLNGLLDLSLGSSKAPGAEHAQTNISSGNLTTSWYGLKGTEDLGGGLSAIFQLEAFFRADTGEQSRFTGDAFWSRSSILGFSSTDWGRLTFGRNGTSLFVNSLLFNAVDGSFGYSPTIRHYYTSGTVTGDSVWNDSVAYTSPTIKGFTFNFSRALSEADGGGNSGASATYFNSGLGLGVAWQKAKKGAAVQDSETWQVSASYDAGFAKLFAQTGKVENTTINNRFDVHGVGFSVPYGAGRFFVQHGVLLNANGPDRRTTTGGYDHFLSKRTDVYFSAMRDRVEGLSGGRSLSLGIRHRF